MPTLGTLRRRAARQGLTLHSVPERSRWYVEIGPYYLCDASTTGIMARRLAFEEIGPELDRLRELGWT